MRVRSLFVLLVLALVTIRVIQYQQFHQGLDLTQYATLVPLPSDIDPLPSQTDPLPEAPAPLPAPTEPVVLTTPAPARPQSVLCTAHPSLCEYGEKTTAHLASRARTPRASHPQARIYLDPDILSFFARPPWLSAQGLAECPALGCTIAEGLSDADVHLTNIRIPEPRPAPRTYAVLNMEPFNLETFPADALLISPSEASDIVINYGYAVSFIAQQTPAFHAWCESAYGGDVFACAVNLVPRLVPTHPTWASTPLGVAWVSQTCGRHEGYLGELKKHMALDFFGVCHRTGDELAHPILRATQDPEGLWWGPGAPAHNNGDRKMLIASQYLFYISFENTILDDYVSEKFYQGFMSGSLMVYLGAPNAADHAPAPHSFVNVHDFPDAQALAQFLIVLAGDPPRYRSYFDWKYQPVSISPRFRREVLTRNVANLDNTSMLCRLCAAVQ